MPETAVDLDGRRYRTEVIVRRRLPGPDPVRILIPIHILNNLGAGLLETAVASLSRFTEMDHEIWVIDNNSHPRFHGVYDRLGDVNVVFNRTEPLNSRVCRPSMLRRALGRTRGLQATDGSYSNAIGLELAVAVLPEEARYVFTMHSDAAPVARGWLGEFVSRIGQSTPVVGALSDQIRVNACHVSGMLVDMVRFRQLGASFMHNMRRERYSERPEYDVGDEISWLVDRDGLNRHTFENTYNSPHLVETIDPDHPFRQLKNTARTFNPEGEVMYIHMGRGASKSAGTYADADHEKTHPEQWIRTLGDFLERAG